MKMNFLLLFDRSIGNHFGGLFCTFFECGGPISDIFCYLEDSAAVEELNEFLDMKTFLYIYMCINVCVYIYIYICNLLK